MKVVVTGGCGFLGSTTVQLLLNEGHDVTVVDLKLPGSKGIKVETEFVRGDVRDTELMARVFAGADEIYHLAGVLGTAELQESLHEAIDINIGGTVTVFEQAVAAGVARVFYPGKPNVWLNAYTITKSAAEQFAVMFNGKQSGTKIMALRYFNAYGPGQALLPIRKIIPAFAVEAKLGLPIEIWGDGEQIVDMIFSRDLADLTIRFTRSERSDILPDCGSGVRMSANDVAAAINAYFGNTAGLVHLPMRPGEVPRTVLTADVSALRGVVGDLRLSSWESSLAETLEWYADLDPSVVNEAASFYGWTR